MRIHLSFTESARELEVYTVATPQKVDYAVKSIPFGLLVAGASVFFGVP